MPDDPSANTSPLDPDADSAPGLRGIGMVALGGSVGTLARYLADTLVADAGRLPLGVLVSNITGAFLLGVLIEALALGGPDRGQRRDLRLLLGTGMLGGYTTYSLFATDVARLLIDRHIAEAIGYGLATVLLGGLASWAGILTARTRSTNS